MEGNYLKIKTTYEKTTAKYTYWSKFNALPRSETRQMLSPVLFNIILEIQAREISQ